MKTTTIKAISTNILFVIGVILIIVGFVRGAQTAVKLATFEQYPLDSYEETRCEYEVYQPPEIMLSETTTEPMLKLNLEAEIAKNEKQSQKCLASLERSRQLSKADDITVSLTTLISGVLLAIIFRKDSAQKE